MERPNFEGARLENQANQTSTRPEKTSFPEFPDPAEAIKGFGRLFNRVVKNASERLPI